VVTVESDLPRLSIALRPWASGNIERIQKLREPAEVDACRAALDSGVERPISSPACAERGWRRRGAPAERGVTVAVMNFDMLLEPGGVL